MAEIRRFLDLSTGHLRPATHELLDAAQDNPVPIWSSDQGFGWFVWVPSDGLVSTPVPDDLAVCLQLARELGVDYILFDRDGPEQPNLPYYGDAT